MWGRSVLETWPHYLFLPCQSHILVEAQSAALSAFGVQNIEELPEIDQHLEKEHQEKTKVKNIQVRGRVLPDLQSPSPAAPVSFKSEGRKRCHKAPVT